MVGVLIVYFSVKQMYLPEDRVAFIKEDISVERKKQSGEIMEALMGLCQHRNKPTHPHYHSAEYASANVLSVDD